MLSRAERWGYAVKVWLNAAALVVVGVVALTCGPADPMADAAGVISLLAVPLAVWLGVKIIRDDS